MQEQPAQFTIDRLEMGTGWVCFQPGDHPPPPDQLPGYLNQAFYTWLERNPDFRVRSVLPITQDGQTVLIHVWFE